MGVRQPKGSLFIVIATVECVLLCILNIATACGGVRSILPSV